MNQPKVASIVSSDNLDINIFKTYKKRVLAGGCFDILHYGHLQFFKASREKGDSLILLLESDLFITKQKKRSPFHSQQERSELLASICYVDVVINLSRIFLHSDYAEIIKKIHPEIISITEGDSFEKIKKEHATSYRANLVSFPRFPFSSSNILTYASISRN